MSVGTVSGITQEQKREAMAIHSKAMDWQEKLGGQIILVVLAGSHGHGFNIEGSDLDRHGIYVAPNDKLLSLNGIGSESHEWKDEEGDLSFHEVGKFLRLCLKGNPTALNVLWFDILYGIEWGSKLREIRGAFLHRSALKAFLGYAQDQMDKFKKGGSVHSKGGKPSGKWLAHIYRLLWQGIELAKTGELPVKFDKERTDFLIKIRTTEDAHATNSKDVEFLISELERYLHGESPCVLPEKPDEAKINQFLLLIRGVK